VTHSLRVARNGASSPCSQADWSVFLALSVSIDIGRLTYTKTDLQKVRADAAALAGAQDLPSTSAATTAAQSYTNSNGGVATSSTVTFNQTNTAIIVVATRHVEYSFLKFVGSGADPQPRDCPGEAVTGYSFAPRWRHGVHGLGRPAHWQPAGLRRP
jgi:hypothetical protein